MAQRPRGIYGNRIWEQITVVGEPPSIPGRAIPLMTDVRRFGNCGALVRKGISALARVDHTNPAHVAAALELFGELCAGFPAHAVRPSARMANTAEWQTP